MKYITFPWEQLGYALRRLSLSSDMGNIAAWALFLLLGALPLASAAFLYRRHRARKADILLAASSLTLYIVLWFFINPSYIDLYLSPMPAGGFAKYLLAAVLDSLLLTWFLLRFVLSCESMTHRKMLTSLRFLLILYALLLAAGTLWQEGSAFATSLNALSENNSGVSSFLINISALFLALQAIVGLLPVAAQIALMLMLGSFLAGCEKELFGEEACRRMEQLKKASGQLLMLVLLANVGCSILQLLFARFVLNSSHQILFPLSEIIVLLGIRVLSFLYLESRRLKEDNDMFI